MQPLRTKKITKPLITKKNHGTSREKKHKLSGQKKSRNLSEQNINPAISWGETLRNLSGQKNH